MPFDDDKDPRNKKGLKKAGSQKSMFDDMPKKPSAEDLEHKVKNIQDNGTTYKIKASELANKYYKALSDKTLKSNKNVFSMEMERELLNQMINLGIEINIDPNETEGMGSMALITLMLKINYDLRDRLNQMEYHISNLEKICHPDAQEVSIVKILSALDKKKNS